MRFWILTFFLSFLLSSCPSFPPFFPPSLPSQSLVAASSKPPAPAPGQVPPLLPSRPPSFPSSLSITPHPKKVRIFACTWNMGGGWAEKELEQALHKRGREGGREVVSCLYICLFLDHTVTLPADALREGAGDEWGEDAPALAPAPAPAPAAAAAAAAAGGAGGGGREGGRGGKPGREVPLLLAKWIPLGYDLYVRREGQRGGGREGQREGGTKGARQTGRAKHTRRAGTKAGRMSIHVLFFLMVVSSQCAAALRSSCR